MRPPSSNSGSSDGGGFRRRGGTQRAIVFDDVHWPLLLVKFTGTPSDTEFARYLDQMTTIVTREERHAVILDATLAHFTPASQQRLQAAWIRRHKSQLEAYGAGTAFVFSSRLFRIVMTGVFMVQPLPMPYAIFATLREATPWALARLGIDAPADGLEWDGDETTRR